MSQPQWIKSSYSTENYECVELGLSGGVVRAIRDSKDPDGPQLTVTPDTFTNFINAIKSDYFEPL